MHINCISISKLDLQNKRVISINENKLVFNQVMPKRLAVKLPILKIGLDVHFFHSLYVAQDSIATVIFPAPRQFMYTSAIKINFLSKMSAKTLKENILTITICLGPI